MPKISHLPERCKQDCSIPSTSMSARRASHGQTASHVAQLQKELSELKNTAIAAPAVYGAEAQGSFSTAAFDSLSGVEKSAASLGVHPDAWRPIGFLK